MNKCLPLCVAGGLLGEKVVLDCSSPLNSGRGVAGGVSATVPIAATHAFGLEAINFDWGGVGVGADAFDVVVTAGMVVTVVVASLVLAGKLLLPNCLAPPSSSTLVVVTEVE